MSFGRVRTRALVREILEHGGAGGLLLVCERGGFRSRLLGNRSAPIVVECALVVLGIGHGSSPEYVYYLLKVSLLASSFSTFSAYWPLKTP